MAQGYTTTLPGYSVPPHPVSIASYPVACCYAAVIQERLDGHHYISLVLESCVGQLATFVLNPRTFDDRILRLLGAMVVLLETFSLFFSLSFFHSHDT
ncbi:hypothetical protein E2C01_014822 [Portunus trituberculatus]|uniref:Uncharacterized protein n=1 Tax=Portunus trituberculatus TaxID=210409 RepID=A0A5B7DJS0_PORTR|nr:hypothetical protein [Portunus trituberculatus]